MDFQTTTVETGYHYPQSNISDSITEQRLNILLVEIAEIEREKSLYASEQERLEALLIKQPLTTEEAYSQLGLLIGVFLPAAIFTMALRRTPMSWFLLMPIAANIISSIVGYHSGKIIGGMVKSLEKKSWSKMLLILPFVGILWAIMAGGAGGFTFFGVGAIFGAIIASFFAVPAILAFTVLHRFLKRGEIIERSQFLPVAFGVTFVLTAFIVGLKL